MADSRWSDLERPPLDVRGLNRALVDRGWWREIRVVDETGSTNADVAALARSGEPEGLVLVAEHQSAGRGRLDRTWSAPARSALTFSLLLRPTEVALPRWTLLPLLVGVAVAKAVSAVAEIEVGLKWPNDLLVGDRKLAGILAERVDTPAGALGPAGNADPGSTAVVVGVGLNVTLRESELPVPTATSLGLANAASTDREILLRSALRTIADDYVAWRKAEGASAALLAQYRELCTTLGRDVRVELSADQKLTGLAVDIDDDGCLVIETSTGRRSVSVGDVVHVR